MFAEVIINNNARDLNKIFDYKVPKELENKAHIGARVFVPFGKSKSLEDGFIINIKDSSEFANKELASIDEKDFISNDRINLAKLMARKYFCNLSECIKLMLPPGTASKDLDDRMKEKKGNFAYLLKNKNEIEILIENKIIKSPKHIKVLRFLYENDGIYIPDLELILEVSSSIIKTLEKNGYIKTQKQTIYRNPFINKVVKSDRAKHLTEEQQKCFDGIKYYIDKNLYSSNLIYGITGSGKTEIYLRIIKEVLDKNKTSIVLVPEISLTPQMVDRFLARFGEKKIAILHSKLSNGERFDEWKKIESGEAKIVIGARSAIFAPVKDLGVIIIDEEHDMSYKSEKVPSYNAKDIAKYLAKQNNCPLVLGSATPDIVTFYNSERDDFNRYTLTKRAGNSTLPDVEIIDLRQELATGNRSMISNRLKTEIENNLKNKKQTILFLNRRGYSTFVMCRDCGYTAKCNNCNITLTYHKFENKLKCHYCGFEMNTLTECPACKSKNIKYFGTGTQKLEDEIHKLFPKASTIRMDIDTVTAKNSHEQILNRFKNDNIDILIGTQMIVKGHHFPNVTLVGVIAADSSLNIGDYRAVERTFQTLVQVAGRAGREKEKGHVIIQTYNPDNYAIIDSKEQNYDKFYKTEIVLRKVLKYPPFCDIILVRFLGEDLQELSKVSNIFYKNLCKYITGNNGLVFAPVPAPIDKIKNKYRWRIIIKGKVNSSMLDAINLAFKGTEKYKKTSIIIDINPNNMG